MLSGARKEVPRTSLGSFRPVAGMLQTNVINGPVVQDGQRPKLNVEPIALSLRGSASRK